MSLSFSQRPLERYHRLYSALAVLEGPTVGPNLSDRGSVCPGDREKLQLTSVRLEDLDPRRCWDLSGPRLCLSDLSSPGMETFDVVVFEEEEEEESQGLEPLERRVRSKEAARTPSHCWAQRPCSVVVAVVENAAAVAVAAAAAADEAAAAAALNCEFDAWLELAVAFSDREDGLEEEEKAV